MVLSRFARGTVEVHSRYGRGSLAVRSRFTRGTAKVRSRYIVGKCRPLWGGCDKIGIKKATCAEP